MHPSLCFFLNGETRGRLPLRIFRSTTDLRVRFGRFETGCLKKFSLLFFLSALGGLRQRVCGLVSRASGSMAHKWSSVCRGVSPMWVARNAVVRSRRLARGWLRVGSLAVSHEMIPLHKGRAREFLCDDFEAMSKQRGILKWMPREELRFQSVA